MAIYNCEYCNELKDDDYSPPMDTKLFDLVCEECQQCFDEEGNEINE
tara:strand:- start:82 stop:222 length:141 start_codon:yes stop_codon:yes gene_type:complete